MLFLDFYQQYCNLTFLSWEHAHERPWFGNAALREQDQESLFVFRDCFTL